MKTSVLIIFSIILVVGYTACPFHTLQQAVNQVSLQGWFSKDKEPSSPPISNNASVTVDNWFNAIVQSEYSTLPGFEGKDISSPLNLIKFSTSSMDVTMDRNVDIMPEGRKKYIHPIGTVAQVKFVPTDFSVQNYDGLFKGANFGLARLSLAANPEKVGFTPGMALKFFRNNGADSGNIISMYGLDGQKDNYNFFQNQMSNWVIEPTSIALKTVETLVFKRASKCPIFLSLQDFGRFDEDGNSYGDKPKVPRSIIFKPSELTQFDTNKKVNGQVKDFRNDLGTLKPNTVIYEVFDADQNNNAENYLGQIITTSRFVASSFGDDNLFFKHDRGEDFGCPK